MSRNDCRSSNTYARRAASTSGNGNGMPLRCPIANMSSGSSVPSMCRCSSALGSPRTHASCVIDMLGILRTPRFTDFGSHTAIRSPDLSPRSELMTPMLTAAGGFLLAVIWMDLMFDVQVLRHRGARQLPTEVTESISTYYRRVTTAASPMNRLIALVMLLLVVGLIVQLVTGDVPTWVSIVSIVLAGAPIGLAARRVVSDAARLGADRDRPAVQTMLARRICQDHIVCFAGMALFVALQIAAG